MWEGRACRRTNPVVAMRHQRARTADTPSLPISPRHHQHRQTRTPRLVRVALSPRRRNRDGAAHPRYPTALHPPTNQRRRPITIAAIASRRHNPAAPDHDLLVVVTARAQAFYITPAGPSGARLQRHPPPPRSPRCDHTPSAARGTPSTSSPPRRHREFKTPNAHRPRYPVASALRRDGPSPPCSYALSTAAPLDLSHAQELSTVKSVCRAASCAPANSGFRRAVHHGPRPPCGALLLKVFFTARRHRRA